MTRLAVLATQWWALAGATAGFLLLYGSVLVGLVNDWRTDDNYSHGFLIPPLAAHFVYERRLHLRQLPVAPRIGAGLAVLLAGLLLLAAGTLGSEFFLSRVSLIFVLSGSILFLWGGRHLRAVAFPLAFLLLMFPIPSIVFNEIAFPLQLLASRLGVALVEAAGVPVLREGNLITLATGTLEVAEACSGIRSLVSLLTLGIVLGYFTDRRASARLVLALATVPLAILTNGFRVAGTGVAAHYMGQGAADGFFHAFSGWLLFGVAFALLLGVATGLRYLFPAGAADVPVAEYSAT